MGTATGWEGILEEGEVILWQGRPDGRFRLHRADAVAGLFGLFFSGFAVFWMFGLIHFSAGIGLMAARPVGSWWRRRHSFYSLSNRRAFIASNTPFRGRALRFWDIRPDSVLDLIGSAPQTVLFATEAKRGAKGTETTTRIGFEGIHDGRRVIGLMRDIQRGAA
ncbi:aspartate carbamoyltransferase catalytic subunit [Ruixingdingia sedimenti]|uniref:Aspartate carbamoyltransferase catalytic subunit n=1 Tax=Ruixingdingia sedimenti TaxID=3073604 RepID=A0ABU1FAD0_9RHOB|nr:aspartate carbamoyltransferase catalytic subunit [Xinfangfangia sp. LG-4]MDR5653372.1 aspartate carbamoyltransferase catalytic subunit [Xinfangfangia sp. LG-4]